MTLLEIIATLLALSAGFGFINHKFIRLPHSIGLALIALASSLVTVGVDLLCPGFENGSTDRQNLEIVDFRNVLPKSRRKTSTVTQAEEGHLDEYSQVG